MVRAGQALVDRLNERGFVDRWGFLIFALAGSLAILIAKGMRVDPVWVALAAAAVMVLYAAIVHLSGTGRLRGDQAGDNCYYLGLIYTLTSLAYAIFVFNPSSAAESIIQGFGIALATTIMGLVLRVFFNQTRVDLVQTEDTARLELAEAAGRLKAELSSVTVNFNDFGRQTRQSLEELRDAVVQTLKETQDATRQSLAEASEQARAAIGQDAEGSTSRAKRLASTTEKVISSIERQATTIEAIESASQRISAGLSAVQEAAETTRTTVLQLAGAATDMASVQADMRATGSELRTSAGELLQHVRAFDGSVTRLDQVLGARLDEIVAAPGDLAIKTKAELEGALASLRDSLAAVSEAQAQLAADLSGRTQESAAIAARHNEALEAELGRSRENVGKVHAALVDMTGRLADRIEANVGG